MRERVVAEYDGRKTVYLYNEQDQHVRTTDYNASGAPTCDIQYDLDPDGEVRGWRVYLPPGVLFKRFERHYDAKGLIEDRQFSPEGVLELRVVETRDESGRYRRVTLDAEGQPLDGGMR